MCGNAGEQRCQNGNNTGRAATDRRLQASYYDSPFPSTTRPPLNTEARLLEKDGRFEFTFNEDIRSKIPAYRMEPAGLVGITLTVGAFERAEYRDLATAWEQQNSPLCVASNYYQPIVDDANQVLSYGHTERNTGVTHFILYDIDGNQLSDQTIAEKGLESDIIGNELVVAVATLGGSILVRTVARGAISAGARFLGAVIADAEVNAARGVTSVAFRVATLSYRAMRGRALVTIFRLRGLKVVVNIGGTAAKHELKEGAQIAVNPLLQGINRPIPNLIQEGGESIGSLFSKGTVDRLLSFRLPTSVNTNAIAKGAATVLKDGGTLEMRFFSNDAEFLNTFVGQLRNQGFKNIELELLPPFPGAKPIPSGLVKAIR